MCWKRPQAMPMPSRLKARQPGPSAGEESVLATFTLDGRALGSELVTIDGAMPRYVRWKATAAPAASDRIRIAVSLIRK